MQLPDAIKELADLLSVAVGAVNSLVSKEPRAVSSHQKIAKLLEEVQQLSEQLRDAANRMGNDGR